MAYNLIAEAPDNFDWESFNDEVQHLDTQAIEVFPIIADEEPGSDSERLYIGISIPFRKIDAESAFWDNLTKAIKIFRTKFGLRLFDIYNSMYIEESNLSKVKESLS